MVGESSYYVLLSHHMVNGILIVECLDEYRVQALEKHTYIDDTPREGLHFDSEKLCFDPEEDDLIDDEEDVCICRQQSLLIVRAIDIHNST